MRGDNIHPKRHIDAEIPEGVYQILKERMEQITKHGYDLERDNHLNVPSDLEQAAKYCLTLDDDDYPKHWEHWFKAKALSKNKQELRAIAGALLAAAYDLQKYINENPVSN